MKYQIIVQNSEFLADDEADLLINDEIKSALAKQGFEFLYVINLQHIRKEVYEKQTQLINQELETNSLSQLQNLFNFNGE